MCDINTFSSSAKRRAPRAAACTMIFFLTAILSSRRFRAGAQAQSEWRRRHQKSRRCAGQ